MTDPLHNHGTSIPAYKPTEVYEQTPFGNHWNNLLSVVSMPEYQHWSQEELRMFDYQVTPLGRLHSAENGDQLPNIKDRVGQLETRLDRFETQNRYLREVVRQQDVQLWEYKKSNDSLVQRLAAVEERLAHSSNASGQQPYQVQRLLSSPLPQRKLQQLPQEPPRSQTPQYQKKRPNYKRASAYYSFLAQELPKVKEEFPDMDHQAQILIVSERWKKSPDNPRYPKSMDSSVVDDSESNPAQDENDDCSNRSPGKQYLSKAERDKRHSEGTALYYGFINSKIPDLKKQNPELNHQALVRIAAAEWRLNKKQLTSPKFQNAQVQQPSSEPQPAEVKQSRIISLQLDQDDQSDQQDNEEHEDHEHHEEEQ